MDIDPDLVCQTLYLAKFTPSYCKGPLPLKSDDSFCISQHPPHKKKVVYCRINCKRSTLVLQVLAQQTGHEGNISAQCSHTHVGVRPD